MWTATREEKTKNKKHEEFRHSKRRWKTTTTETIDREREKIAPHYLSAHKQTNRNFLCVISIFARFLLARELFIMKIVLVWLKQQWPFVWSHFFHLTLFMLFSIYFAESTPLCTLHTKTKHWFVSLHICLPLLKLSNLTFQPKIELKN